jgi:hypothetical protein
LCQFATVTGVIATVRELVGAGCPGRCRARRIRLHPKPDYLLQVCGAGFFTGIFEHPGLAACIEQPAEHILRCSPAGIEVVKEHYEQNA